MLKLKVFLLSNLFTLGLFSIDPGLEMMRCIDDGLDLNYCAAQVLENSRTIMTNGIPELEVPPIDPIQLDLVEFRIFNLTTQFKDLSMRGLKDFKLLKSEVNKDDKLWKVELSLPRVDSVGTYRMSGTIPPNLDLGLSTGEGRFSADKVFLTSEMTFGAVGDRVQVTDLDLTLRLDDINLELECLFPRANGKCCPRKYLRSCNATLAKTVLRFINNDGKKFVKNFQPEILRIVKPILLKHFNRAIYSAEARYLINV